MTLAAAPVIDINEHLEWAEMVGRKIARKFGFHISSQNSEDLKAEAVYKLIEKAPEFVAARIRTNTRDAFRGWMHSHIAGHCSKAAIKLTNAGTYNRRREEDHPRMTGVHIGLLGYDDDGDRDNEIGSVFSYISEEFSMDSTAPTLPAPRPEIDSILALEAQIKSLRCHIAEKEAEANRLAELKKLFAPLAAFLNGDPAMKTVLSGVLQVKCDPKPRTPDAPADGKRRYRKRKHPAKAA